MPWRNVYDIFFKFPSYHGLRRPWPNWPDAIFRIRDVLILVIWFDWLHCWLAWHTYAALPISAVNQYTPSYMKCGTASILPNRRLNFKPQGEWQHPWRNVHGKKHIDTFFSITSLSSHHSFLLELFIRILFLHVFEMLIFNVTRKLNTGHGAAIFFYSVMSFTLD